MADKGGFIAEMGRRGRNSVFVKKPPASPASPLSEMGMNTEMDDTPFRSTPVGLIPKARQPAAGKLEAGIDGA